MNWTSRVAVSWVVLLVVGAVVWAAPSRATAQAPYVVGLYGYPGWNVYGQDYIPYFSRHPPVYYSYPVPRAYGFSPYAYPPGTPTPELLPLRPAVFRTSPHRAAASTTTTVEQPHPAPLRIKNPFVK